MSLSSMPTGIVSRDGTSSRTYPPDGIDNGPSETASSASVIPASSATSTDVSTTSSAPPSSPASVTPSTQASTASQSRDRQQSHSRQRSRGRRPSPPADARGRDAFQRENKALRRANARLNARLDSAETNRQEVIDRYERLLAERRNGSRKQTHDCSAPRNDWSRRSGVEPNMADAARSAVGCVVEGVASTLGRR